MKYLKYLGGMKMPNNEEEFIKCLKRIEQHLEAIALCMCRREKISIPVFRDDDVCNLYNHLPDQEDQEENEAVFADRIPDC